MKSPKKNRHRFKKGNNPDQKSDNKSSQSSQSNQPGQSNQANQNQGNRANSKGRQDQRQGQAASSPSSSPNQPGAKTGSRDQRQGRGSQHKSSSGNFRGQERGKPSDSRHDNRGGRSGPRGQDRGRKHDTKSDAAGKYDQGASQKRQPTAPAIDPMPPPYISKGKPKRYVAVFYDTPQAAKDDLTKLTELESTCDQINIVIRAESDMDDPILKSEKRKVFAGSAWTLIHERRIEEGWYNEPH